jgi:hypothetical protein
LLLASCFLQREAKKKKKKKKKKRPGRSRAKRGTDRFLGRLAWSASINPNIPSLLATRGITQIQIQL